MLLLYSSLAVFTRFTPLGAHNTDLADEALGVFGYGVTAAVPSLQWKNNWPTSPALVSVTGSYQDCGARVQSTIS